MAKKKAGKSLSQSIRDYLQANPSATANQIVEALAKKGINVSPGLASNVIRAIDIDADGTVWIRSDTRCNYIGCGGGISSFDGTTWTVYRDAAAGYEIGVGRTSGAWVWDNDAR